MKGILKIKRVIIVLYVLGIVLSQPIIANKIAVDRGKSQQLTVDKTANNIPLVNINKPKAGGISHNYFDEYNVEKEGVILNNGKDFSASQLGGTIYGNPNFQQGQAEAKTILTEVTGIERTRLEGFTEIAGKSADYIMANPNGIYMNGAGFINAPRVTLTTGKSSYDSSGELRGFDVGEGTVVVGSMGVDGRETTMFDIVSRTAELEGAIYAGDRLNIILGANEYKYKDGTFNKKNKLGVKPRIALDGKALGSMYSGRIFLHSTEDGVGVNSESDMLADSGDLIIDVNGELKLKNGEAEGNIGIKSQNVDISEKLIAKKNIDILSKDIVNQGKILSDALEIDTSNLKNTGDISGMAINIRNQNLVENNGNLKGSNLFIETDSLNNTKNMVGADFVLEAGTLVNDGMIISTDLTIVSDEIINKNSITGETNLKLMGNTKLENQGKIIGKNIDIRGDEVENQDTIYSEGELNIAVNNFKNSGTTQSENNFKIKSTEINNDGNLYTGMKIDVESTGLTNSGKIISDEDGVYTVENAIINQGLIQGQNIILKDIENSGDLTSLNDMSIKKIKNSGTVSSLNNLDITQGLENDDSGIMVSGKNIKISGSLINKGILSGKEQISADNIENTGNIYSDGGILLNNLKRNSGSIEGIDIKAVNTGVLDNRDGKIKAGSDGSRVDIESNDVLNSGGEILSQGELLIKTNDFLAQGKYAGNKKIDITAKTLKNRGEIESLGNINLSIIEGLINENKITGTLIDVATKNFTNNGDLGSFSSTVMTIINSVINNGMINLGKDGGEINAGGNIKNTEFLIAQGEIKLKGDEIINQGQIAGGENLTLEGNRISNENNGSLYSGGDMKIISNNAVENNESEIYSNKDIKIDAGGKVSNILGGLEAQGNIEVKAQSLENIGKLTGTHSVVKESGLVSDVDQNKINKIPIENQMNITMNQLYEGYIKPKITSNGSWDWHTGLSLYKADKIISNYTSNQSYISSGKNINIELLGNLINREGKIGANSNIDVRAKQLINENQTEDIKIKLYWKKGYELHGGAMYKLNENTDYLDGRAHNSNRDKGIIIVESESIQRVGSDKATKISAGRILNITAEKVGNGVLASDKTVVDDSHINIKTVSLNNNDVKLTGAIETEDYIKVPTGNKGLFVVKKGFGEIENINISKDRGEPGFSYLIETNVEHIDLNKYAGASYFLDRINFSPEKDTRLLGDSFYETKYVNRAIYEATGKRYLGDAKSETQQMKILYDNSIKAMDDMNISFRVALTRNQINNLKENIIWYVKEEVSGVEVLVPKVYLSKETLAQIDGTQTGIDAGESMNISALELDNTGLIKSSGEARINIDELLNKSIKGGTRARIEGNNLDIISIGNIKNIGADIRAKNKLSLTSLEGDIINISTKRVNTNIENRTASKIENIGTIESQNEIYMKGDKLKNVGAKIKAGGDIFVETNEILIDAIELHNYEKKGGSENYTITESVKNVGNSIEGKNISLNAKKDVGIKGSDIIAEKDLSLSVGGDINILASVDSDYYEKKKTRKKSWGRSKVTKDIKYNESIDGSNLVAEDNLKIKSGNNVNVVGSNLSTGKNLSVNADNNVNVISALKGSSDYHESQKTGFLGLSGTSRKEIEVNYTNAASNIKTTGDMEIVSKKGDVRVLASNLESKKDINIGAGNDVNILAADDIIKKQKQKTKYGIKYFASADNLNFQVGNSTSIEKNKKTSYDTKIKGSNLLSDGDISIIGNKNVTVEASNLSGNDNNIYAGNKLNVRGRDEVHKETVKNEKIEVTQRVGLNLSGIKNTITSIKDAVIGIKDLPEVVSVMTNLINGKGLNESLEGNEDGLNALNNTLNGPLDGGVSAGIYVGAEFSTDKNTQENTNKVVSMITSQNNVNLKTNQGDMNFEGTRVNAGNNINIDSGKDININSAVNTGNGRSSSFNINGEYNVLTGEISGEIGGSKGSNSDKTHSNAEFVAGNKADILGGNLMIKGGNIIGNEVKIDVKNLVVESVQDKSSSQNIGLNLNMSSGDKNSSNSGGGGLNYSNYNKELVEDQSTIMGVENSEIKVAENTNLAGGLLGGGNTTLDTGTLKYSNINDKEKGIDIGISGSASENKKAGSTGNKISVEGSYGAVDREQITNATIGNGTIIVGGEEKNLDINRDESKGPEITKDININTITGKYSSDKRKWNEVQDIMGEHGKSLGKELDVVTGNKYNLEEELDEGFKKTYSEIEKVIDRDLFNSKIGLIPTKENSGVIGFSDGAERGGEKPYLAKYTSPTPMDENGVIGVNAELTSLTKENLEEAGKKDPKLTYYMNGIGNTKKDVAEGAINGALNPEDIEALKSGGTVYKVIIHNPTNGLPTDLVESVIGVGGILFGSNYNTKDLEEIFKKYPETLSNTMFHSQGTIKGTQAISNLVEEGKIDPSETNLRYAGSPVNQSMAEKGLGRDITYLNNPWDPVAFLNFGKTTVKKEIDHPVTNYNINFEKKKDGIYERPDKLKVGGQKDGEKIIVRVDKFNGEDTRTTWERLYDKFTKKED